MNYTYRIYPNTNQSAQMLEWLKVSRKVYNSALRELKDWINSRKCMVDRCSIEREGVRTGASWRDLPELTESRRIVVTGFYLKICPSFVKLPMGTCAKC